MTKRKDISVNLPLYLHDATSRFFGKYKVRCAVDHVNMGTDALQTAKTLQKKSRKCMMIAIILLLIIAAIIVLSVIKPWKK